MKKFKYNLTTVIFISLLLGFFVGMIFHYGIPSCYVRDTIFIDGLFYILGNGFIRAMQMLVVPLVLCSIICGTMSMGDTRKMGRIGGTTLVFYLLTTVLAITIALVIGNIINPGVDLDMQAIRTAETQTVKGETSFVQTILDIIPLNPFEAMATGNMLQVIVFALIVGGLLAYLGEKTTGLAKLAEQGNTLMMSMTTLVMKAAPIGVFCLIARTFANIGFEGFAPMLKYMGAVLLALAIQCFGVYGLMLKLLSGLNPIRFINKFLPVMGFAFSTATSNATIPLSIGTLKRKIGVSEEISSFTIPLGATINMDGTAIMQGVAVVFVAQAYSIDLSMTDYLTVIATATMASIGTAGVPSVGLVMLSMVFTSVGLPVEGIAMIIGIDRILDMARTTVNITGDAICTTIVAKMNGKFDKNIFLNKG
ncbi:MAG: dicarboxylate/amino acid:cation symporter [Bacteroides sp.]|nr:dicarboxylate/amino acid:cation symporter [Bacteroides sp.]